MPRQIPARRAPLPHRLAHSASAAGWRGSTLLWRVADLVATHDDVVATLAPGVVVPVDRGDWIADTAYRGTYERVELGLLPRLLRPGCTVIDVGANLGVYALRAASIVGPTGRVIAVEPSPRCLGPLRAVVDRLGLDQIDVRAVAVTDDTVAEVVLEVPAGASHAGLSTLRGAVRSSDQVTVPAVALDALIPDGQIDLLKLDVEGWEEHVLRSGPRVLAERRIRWALVEVSPEFGSVDGLADVLGSLDRYSLFAIGEAGHLRRRPALRLLTAGELARLEHQENILVGREDVVEAPWLRRLIRA